MIEEKKEAEKDFSRHAFILDYAKLNQMILKDLKNSRNTSKVFRKYKRSDVLNFLDNPEKSEKQLREISISLYNKSPQYRRLTQYFAYMLTLAYIVEPTGIDYEKYNVKTLGNQYKKILKFLDQMNIKHEFSKILTIAFREDAFFGYEHMTNNSYFIQKLNADYCMISSIEDGCFNFAFDFTYFQTYPEKLAMYPKEFKTKFNRYLKDSNLRWQELDSTKTICIKINEDLEYCMPPFVSLFESIFDIQEYKDLRKDKTEISNYKLLVQKLPIRKDSDSNNDFMIDYDNMVMFHNRASAVLPDQVTMITTPMDITDISFEKDTADNDNVSKAVEELWEAGGVSRFLFSSDKSSSVGLENSIRTDEMIAFTVLRQIERWINRRLKFFISNVNFRVNMLDMTIFNQQKIFDNALKASQYGFATKIMAGVALGLSPSAVTNMAILENEILKLPEKMIPVSSSHTGGQNEVLAENLDGGQGAPMKDSSELTDAGVKTRDNS